MLEFYEAYVDYQHLMAMTEEMLADVALRSHRRPRVPVQRATTMSFTAPFRRLSLRHAAAEAATEHLGRAVTDPDLRDREKAAAVAKALGFEVKASHGAGKLATTIFEGLWEDQLVQPTFVYDFPTEVSPLSKQKPDDLDTVERFEMYAGGFEVANGFSELNDPAEQRRRFEGQLKDRAAGDSRGAPDGRRLRPRPRIRHAPHRRRGHRHRPARDAPHGEPVDSGCDSVPSDAPCEKLSQLGNRQCLSPGSSPSGI